MFISWRATRLLSPPVRPVIPPAAEQSMAEAAELLAKLSTQLSDMEQATPNAVDLAGRVQRAEVPRSSRLFL